MTRSTWRAAAVGDCRGSVGDPEHRGARATPTHEEHAAQIHKAGTVVPQRPTNAAHARAHKSQRRTVARRFVLLVIRMELAERRTADV